MPEKVAKIAVSAATYWIDKPYEYRIPEILGDAVQPGMRISVPFSAGNRRSEGIVLAVSDVAEHEKLKNVTAVLDDAPLLTQQQLQLAGNAVVFRQAEALDERRVFARGVLAEDDFGLVRRRGGSVGGMHRQRREGERRGGEQGQEGSGAGSHGANPTGNFRRLQPPARGAPARSPRKGGTRKSLGSRFAGIENGFEIP